MGHGLQPGTAVLATDTPSASCRGLESLCLHVEQEVLLPSACEGGFSKPTTPSANSPARQLSRQAGSRENTMGSPLPSCCSLLACQYTMRGNRVTMMQNHTRPCRCQSHPGRSAAIIFPTSYTRSRACASPTHPLFSSRKEALHDQPHAP